MVELADIFRRYGPDYIDHFASKMLPSHHRAIEDIVACRAGKYQGTVKARSLLCYWAVRKLGFSATELSKKLGVSQPSVSISVKRGEKIAKARQLKLIKE